MMEFVQAICYRFSGDIRAALTLTCPKAGDTPVMAALTAMNRASIDFPGKTEFLLAGGSFLPL